MTGAVIVLLLLIALMLAEAGSRRRLRRLHQPGRGLSRLVPDLLAVGGALCLLTGAMPLAPPVDATRTLALVVDVSTSMAAADGGMTRLDRARRELLTLLDLLPQTRFALIPFAGEAVVQVAPTGDRAALRFFIDQLTAGMIAADGSAPEEAIQLAQKLLMNETGDRQVVLFSDGERTLLETAPQPAATVPVWVVPLGSAEGAEVPGHPGERSLPDPDRLQRLAAASGGKVLQPDTGPAVLELAASASARLQPQLVAALPQLALLLLVLRLLPGPRLFRLHLSAAVLALIISGCPGDRTDALPAARFAEGLRAAQSGLGQQAQADFAAAAAGLDGAARAAALYNQATLLLQGGEAARALPLLESALLLTPDDADLRDQLLLALQMHAETPQTADDAAGSDDSAEGGQLTLQRAMSLLQSIDPDPAALPATRLPAGRPVKAVW